MISATSTSDLSFDWIALPVKTVSDFSAPSLPNFGSVQANYPVVSDNSSTQEQATNASENNEETTQNEAAADPDSSVQDNADEPTDQENQDSGLTENTDLDQSDSISQQNIAGSDGSTQGHSDVGGAPEEGEWGLVQ